MRSPLPINFLPKAFVVRYQNPILRKGFLDDGIIIQATRLIVHGKNLISLFTQPFRNGGSGAFIHKEAHLCWIHG